jgi:hypothetical protein
MLEYCHIAIMSKPSIQRIQELVSYDPITGVLSWRVKKGKCFAGQEIRCQNGAGYIVVRIDDVLYRAHRIAWVIMNGAWPDGEIDHINRIRSDNRFCNLRIANRSQNMQNINTPSTNKSGKKGVSFDKKTCKWRADIKADGKRFNLGRFNTIEEAEEAYKKASAKLHGMFSFHKNLPSA